MVQNQFEKQLERCKTKSTNYSSKGLYKFPPPKGIHLLFRRKFFRATRTDANETKDFRRQMKISMRSLAFFGVDCLIQLQMNNEA